MRDEAVGQGGKLGLAARVGEPEAAAHLAIAGRKRGVRADAQTRIAAQPGGIQRGEKFGIARAHDEFEVFALGEQLLQRLLAQARTISGGGS